MMVWGSKGMIHYDCICAMVVLGKIVIVASSLWLLHRDSTQIAMSVVECLTIPGTTEKQDAPRSIQV